VVHVYEVNREAWRTDCVMCKFGKLYFWNRQRRYKHESTADSGSFNLQLESQ